MAKEKIAKTNAARLLDKDKIAYELIPYEVDENDLSCIHVAASFDRFHMSYISFTSCWKDYTLRVCNLCKCFICPEAFTAWAVPIFYVAIVVAAWFYRFHMNYIFMCVWFFWFNWCFFICHFKINRS